MKKIQFAGPKINERELSLDILIEVSKGKFLNMAIEECFEKKGPDRQQRNFIRALCEGVVERQLTLDHIISRQLKSPSQKMKGTVRQILRMGTYQLKFMEGVPSYAAINEAVALTAKRVSPSLKGFVNGVLRSVSEDGISPEDTEDLSVRWSCPGWIIERFKKYPGEEYVEDILRASLERPELYGWAVRSFANVLRNPPLRDTPLGRNSLRMTEAGGMTEDASLSGVADAAEQVMGELALEGAVCKKSPILEGAFVIKELPVALNELQAFKAGAFMVQDISSQLCARVGAKAVLSRGGKDLRVLDLCAAPGGKTLYTAGLLSGRGRVLARDISMAKVKKINENLVRLGYENVDLEVGDATVYEPSFEDGFDLVIADLPCSGLGVMSRKAELKYRLRKEDISSLASLGRIILDNGVRYVKKGGLLLYSTCTVTPEENGEQFDYLREVRKMRPVDMDAYLPEAFRKRTGSKGFLQLIQGVDGTDGFYISLFSRDE